MHYFRVRAFARAMRRNSTPAEDFFWQKVRNRKFLGKKFNRQFIIECGWNVIDKRFVIVDFYCHEHKLIVEVDGGIHHLLEEQDQMRQQRLEEMGYRVVRFRNEEVLEDWAGVAEKLAGVLHSR